MPPRKPARKAQLANQWPLGPNAQVNKLQSLLDAQLKKEDALDITSEELVRDKLGDEIDKGATEITGAMNDLLQDPFARQRETLSFTDEERAALRALKAALQTELNDPSNANSKALSAANKSLVRSFGATRPKEIAKAWEPKKYRILNRKDPAYDSSYESSSDEEETMDVDAYFMDAPPLPAELLTKFASLPFDAVDGDADDERSENEDAAGNSKNKEMAQVSNQKPLDVEMDSGHDGDIEFENPPVNNLSIIRAAFESSDESSDSSFETSESEQSSDNADQSFSHGTDSTNSEVQLSDPNLSDSNPAFDDDGGPAKLLSQCKAFHELGDLMWDEVKNIRDHGGKYKDYSRFEWKLEWATKKSYDDQSREFSVVEYEDWPESERMPPSDREDEEEGKDWIGYKRYNRPNPPHQRQKARGNIVF